MPGVIRTTTTHKDPFLMTFYLRQTTISKDISKFIITEAIIFASNLILRGVKLMTI